MAKLDPEVDKNVIAGFPPADIYWTLDDVADVYSRRLLPVRDVIVFGVATGGIAAYDVKDGARRWSASDLRTKSGYLSLSDRLVIGADQQGVLRTFVPSTGERKWTCPAAEAATLLAADKEAVYFVTQDDKLRSVRRADAKVRWTATIPAEFRKKLLDHAAIGQGKLVVPTSDGNVLAVHTSDGRQAWARRDHADVSVRPAVADGTAYINGKTLDARKLTDGELIWRAELSDWETDVYKWGPPAVYSDRIYVNAGDDTRCLNRPDGNEVWRAPFSATYASPALLQGNGAWAIYSGSTAPSPQLEVNTVWASSGEQGWTYQFPMSEYHRLAADGNRVFLMNDSTVHALTVF
ncbi:PQQ-binding-like beta-propeller repeat protein [Streptomyces sp. PSKA30]|uniref:outer membrane protein assembly factor BamB family protein n=1 Tax=Streptomyces sp. PSKA30 TaxID=2874597 RepID=UPI0027E01137|nr:PQQ-binding-like beta-propeller repeat protein [Streptomyces sp. PSKA30]